MSNKEKVLLTFDGSIDYLFEIEDVEMLKKAINHKDKVREEEKFDDYSDIEIIIDYLQERNVAFDYIELFSLKQIEY